MELRSAAEADFEKRRFCAGADKRFFGQAPIRDIKDVRDCKVVAINV